MAGYVFISYSRSDRTYIDALARHLTNAGIPVWFDYDLEAGDEFAQRIESAIDGCAAFLLVLTPRSVASEWVRLELARAQRLEKPRLPLLLLPCVPPIEVEGVQIEDCTGGRMPSNRFVSRLAGLLDAHRLSPPRRIARVAQERPETLRQRRRPSLTVAIVAAATVVAVTLGITAYNVFGPDEPVGTVVVGVDLPFHGRYESLSRNAWNAMNFYLEGVGGRAGKFKVELKKYDDSTETKSAWDEVQCRANADSHIAAANEVAVVGVPDTGCAKIIAPILNSAPGGPMLMVSHWATGAGLTRPWEDGEPEQYFPTGERSFARVIGNDEALAQAAARFAEELKADTLLVLNDGSPDGKRMAAMFTYEAHTNLATVFEGTWHGKGPFTSLFQQAKKAGVKAVFLAGSFEQAGAQLIKDKVAVLGDQGDNGRVELIVPDEGFGTYEFGSMPEAQFAKVVSAGLDGEYFSNANGAPTTFRNDFEARYSEDIYGYEMYSVQALQIVLAAIEKSNGTRRGVRDAVFLGDGVKVPANVAMIGKDLIIDRSGDPSPKEFMVDIVTGTQFGLGWRTAYSDISV